MITIETCLEMGWLVVRHLKIKDVFLYMPTPVGFSVVTSQQRRSLWRRRCYCSVFGLILKPVSKIKIWRQLQVALICFWFGGRTITVLQLCIGLSFLEDIFQEFFIIVFLMNQLSSHLLFFSLFLSGFLWHELIIDSKLDTSTKAIKADKGKIQICERNTENRTGNHTKALKLNWCDLKPDESLCWSLGSAD